MPSFDIFFFSQSVSLSLKNKKDLKKCLVQLLNCEKIIFSSGEVNVIFCDDRYLSDLNQRYLNHQTLTDVITFDYSSGSRVNGDIFISIERVKDNAKKFSQIFLTELTRVIIHGFLHLCGYNDKLAEDKYVMTQKEDFYLEVFWKIVNEKNDKKSQTGV